MGLEGKLSAYLTLLDTRIFWSAMLGFIGIPLEGLCYFGVYRLIAPYSEKYAHMYRTGILGYLAFGGCGVHVPCLASVWAGMTGGKEVPEFMKYLQLGDYTGLKDVYLSFGGDEVFLAGAESIKKRLEEFNVRVTLEIGEELYHSYAMMPLVKDAKEGYQHFLDYISVR